MIRRWLKTRKNYDCFRPKTVSFLLTCSGNRNDPSYAVYKVTFTPESEYYHEGTWVTPPGVVNLFRVQLPRGPMEWSWKAHDYNEREVVSGFVHKIGQRFYRAVLTAETLQTSDTEEGEIVGYVINDAFTEDLTKPADLEAAFNRIDKLFINENHPIKIDFWLTPGSFLLVSDQNVTNRRFLRKHIREISLDELRKDDEKAALTGVDLIEEFTKMGDRI